MKSSSLRESYVRVIRALRFDLGLYRVLAIFSSFALVAFGGIMPLSAHDPMIIRVGLAVVVLGLFGASYASSFVRQHIAHFGQALLYGITIWAGWLVAKNAFSQTYLIHFLLVSLLAGSSFKRLRAWAIYSCVVIAAGLAACILSQSQDANLWFYLPALAFILGIAELSMAFRITFSKELDRQRRLVASIFENSPDAILIANAETLTVRATNQNANRMFGVGGLKTQAVLHQQLTTWLKDYLHDKEGVARIGKGLSKLETLQATEIWGEIVITELSTDDGPELLVSISDVTEKELISRRLQLSNDILEHVDHIVLVADRNADIIYVTPSVKSVLGYDTTQVLGKGWWDIKRKNGDQPDQSISYIKALARGETQPKPANYEMRHQDATGKEQWILWKDSRTPNGFVIGVGMLHTKARREETVRSVIFNIAEASSRAKNPGEFYHYIHHEIRRLIDTPNFYIAVYDSDHDEVSFPYYKDAEDSNYLARASRKRKAGKGLTEYGIRSQKPVLLAKEDIYKLNDRGAINISGQSIPEVWLGVPLMHDEGVVGLITIQNYAQPNAYDQDDLTLVNFVASQVAQFVAKLQADEALRLSEERFRSIYKQAAVGIAQLTPEGTFLQVNEKMTDIFGYQVDELLQMVPMDFTHPEDLDLGRDELIEVMEGKRQSYSKEKRYIHKHGHIVHALLNVSAYREDGVPIFVISVYEDITDKKRAQYETLLLLRLSTGLNTVESIDQAVAITLEELANVDGWEYAEATWIDPVGAHHPCTNKIVRNEAFEALGQQVNVLPEDLRVARLSGEVIWENHPEASAFQHAIASAKSMGAVSIALLPILHEGEPIVVMLLASSKEAIFHPSLEKLANAVGSQLLAVHLRKMAEAARIESENRYRAITQAAFEGIAIYQGHHILDCNAAFARAFAYEPDEVLAVSLTDLIEGAEADQILAALAAGDRNGVEFLGRKKNGETVYMEALSRQDQWHGQVARILAVRDITSQKLMEEARESARLDARFKAYIQNSAEIIKIIDADGHIQYCSPSYDKIFGAPAESVLGQSNAELMLPEDRASYLLALEEVRLHPQESQQLQLRFPYANGSNRIVQAKLTNLIDDPMIKGILISEGDITNVIEAQVSRQESEERFKLLFERSPDAIFVESEEGYVLDVNDAACRLQEMTREELIGAHVGDLSSPDKRQTVVDGFADLMSGRINYLEGESFTKSQKIVEVEIRCNVIHFNNQRALLLLVRDISQRKKEQLLLKESEERFRALVEHATEAIFVIDVERNRMTEVNKNAGDLFGYSREELLEISPATLHAPRQAGGRASEELQPELYARALAGELVVYDWLFQNEAGKEIPCEVRLVRFPSATQQLLRASVTDITARKQAEAKMQRSREILKVQNERLIELAASNAVNSGDLDLAFEEITKAISDLLQVTMAGVWLFDQTAERLLCHKEYNAEKGVFVSGRVVRVSEYPKYFALIERERVIAVEDALTAESVAEFLEKSIIPRNIRGVLDAPFRHGGRIAGMIWTMQLDEPRVWEPEELNLVASMADMVTLALQSWERKKAESELANTLTKMQATFESTRDGILLLDPKGFLLDYNEEFVKLSQVPKDELDNGQRFPGFETMMTHIVDPELFKEAIIRIRKHPEAEERYVYHTHSGHVIEMYGRQMLVDYEPRGMLWFLHDITDLKRVEKALLENETKFRSLFSQANDAIILLDKSTFIECNTKAEEMWGLSRAELIGKKSFELSPEFQPDGQRSIDKAAQNTTGAYNGESQRFYWQHTRGDGQPFDAEVSLNRIQIGEHVYIQALVRDITERLKTENALLDSERNNKALLDGIPDLILRITGTGTILDYKQSDQQSHLRIAEAAAGKTLTDVLPRSLAQRVLDHAAQAIEQGRSMQFESELKLDGEAVDYETRIVLSGTAEVLAIIRDVTERKRTEKELIKRNFELDSFVYRASHDLKAPLNSLMGLINLVEGETQEPGVLSYIRMMNKSVVKLDTFIRDLADFSRNARMDLIQEVINWEVLLHETLENLQFADGADRIRKKVQLQFDGVFYSDPVRLGIIFNNLISNAIKYQNLKRDDAEVSIKVVREGDVAVITIADNGIGIAKEHQPKIYNLFFRASIQSYGSGMGMYIVKQATDRIKGTIEMVSDEGKGTTFIVRLANLGPPLEDEKAVQ